MEDSEVTDLLAHNILPNFPVTAEALWEISLSNERDQGLFGAERRRSVVEKLGGGGRSTKRKDSFRSDGSISSALFLVVDDRCWPFGMHRFEYRNAIPEDVRRRAVVFVQDTNCWYRGYTNNVEFNDASAYKGHWAKADVYSLKSTGKKRGLWMKNVNTDETAVKMQLATSLAST